MAGKRALLLASLCMMLLGSRCVNAQNPITNPGFESGLSGWVTYAYSAPPSGTQAEPVTGCIGLSPCLFDLLSPLTTPEGSKVCGMQTSGGTKNGGVCQTFNWVGGPATLSLTARAYSEKFPADGGGAWDTGCRVRMGLVAGPSQSREDVTSWVTLPWGDSWSTRSISVPAGGLYTLFIESLQPSPTAVLSTLWDNVAWTQLPPIAGDDLTVLIPGDMGSPESTARITWTTSVPCDSRVDYGPAGAYGQVAQDSALTTSHDMLLTGLTHTTTYHCRASSSASGHAPWASDDFAFSTPIRFSGIFVSPSPNGIDMTVRWTTDVPSTTRVEYGLTTAYDKFTSENPTPSTSHQALLTGLESDQTYHYRVCGRNSPQYTNACSADQTFYSLPPPSPQLQNGGFEDGHGSWARSLYPWVQYTTGNGVVGYRPIDGLVGPYPKSGPLAWLLNVRAYDGTFFLGAGAEMNYKNGGVYQRVSVPFGQVCTLSARHLSLNVGGVPDNTKIRLGIDPNGGVDPAGAGVRWWTMFSPADDSRWHTSAVTTTAAGGTGVVTVFLDIKEQYQLLWHVAALDRIAFGPPLPMTIGELKQSDGDRGAVLSGKIVTQVDPNPVTYSGAGYVREYIQEEDRSAGIAVLFDQNSPAIPNVGDRIDLTGSVVLNNMEAMLIAYQWTAVETGVEPPRPILVPSSAIGGATPVQPALFSGASACNVGLRVRVIGRVTWVDYSDPGMDATAIIDDGSGVLDQWPVRGTITRGIRVKLPANWTYGVNVGDYIEATGVVSVEFIDPQWPPYTGEEYYSYTILAPSSDAWHTYTGSGVSVQSSGN